MFLFSCNYEKLHSQNTQCPPPLPLSHTQSWASYAGLSPPAMSVAAIWSRLPIKFSINAMYLTEAFITGAVLTQLNIGMRIFCSQITLSRNLGNLRPNFDSIPANIGAATA